MLSFLVWNIANVMGREGIVELLLQKWTVFCWRRVDAKGYHPWCWLHKISLLLAWTCVVMRSGSMREPVDLFENTAAMNLRASTGLEHPWVLVILWKLNDVSPISVYGLIHDNSITLWAVTYGFYYSCMTKCQHSKTSVPAACIQSIIIIKKQK